MNDILIQMCSNAEHQAIDAVIDKGPVQAGAMDLKVVQGNHISIEQWRKLILSSYVMITVLITVEPC